jgi:hypothetical protein
MTCYDLCLAWNWEHDADFVLLLDSAMQTQGLTLLQATPENLEQLQEALNAGQISFRNFIDRASEHDPRFAPLIQWVGEHQINWIDSLMHTSRCCNKAAMHYTLINAGLHTPHTIMLPSFEDEPILPAIDLQPLNGRFTIKPAHGGGGDGVIMDATSLNQVLIARREHMTDQYLIQSHIEPCQLDDWPAWFRILHCTGRSYPCWWDPRSHIYTPTTVSEEIRFGLAPLYDIVKTITRLSGLKLLSTEVALTADNLFVVIDYVNDQIDLRLQSKAMDGVPDYIVHDIARRLAGLIASEIQEKA